MTHIVLLLLLVTAFLLLALAMARHQKAVLGRRLPPAWGRCLRVSGFVLMAVALGAAVLGRGLAFGLVDWVGHLSLAAGLVFLGLLMRERFF